MEQLNLFDVVIDEEVKQPSIEAEKPVVKSKFQVMDKVKITLINEQIDSETHHYRKYYEPHLIGKVGEVVEVTLNKKGKFSYLVNFYGTTSTFEEEELVWIG